MGNSPYGTLILIIVMVVAFYFLILRPQRKRQQSQQNTLNQLVPGTRVLTGSGLFGTIVEIGQKQAVLELAPGVEITVLKQAIARVAGPQDEEPYDGEETEDTAVVDTDGTPGDDLIEDRGTQPDGSPYQPYDPTPPEAEGDTTIQNDRPGDERRREDS